MGQLLYFSAADAGVWGERGSGDGSTSCAWPSSIALLSCLPGLPPQAFLTTVCSLMSPLAASLQSIAALTQGLFRNPYAPGLSCWAKGTCIPVQGTYCCSKGCLILIPFKLPQMSCLTLSLKCFSSDPDNCPNVRVILSQLPSFCLYFRGPPFGEFLPVEIHSRLLPPLVDVSTRQTSWFFPARSRSQELVSLNALLK